MVRFWRSNCRYGDFNSFSFLCCSSPLREWWSLGGYNLESLLDKYSRERILWITEENGIPRGELGKELSNSAHEFTQILI